MGLGYTFRLRKGARTLDISSGRYALTDTFTPPGSAEEPIMGPGGGINRRGGSQRVGMTAVNQMFSFELDVSGDSEAEVRQGLRDLRDFLERAGDEGKPLYADWIPHSNVSFQPVHGQWNAQISWEIIFGSIPDFSRLYATNRSNFLPDVMVETAIKPYTLGIEQISGSAAGAIYEDWYGSSMRRSKGVGIPPSGANKFTNPVYGNSDWDNGWTGDTGIQSSQCTEEDLVLFGKNSAELIASLDALDWYQTLTLTATSYVAQCFAKKRDKSAVSSADFSFNYAPVGVLATNFYYIGNGWYWCVSAAFTGQASPQQLGINLALNASVIVDGFMCEARAYASPFGYGDMPGWVWDSTAHASASTRTAAQLGFNWDTLINPAQGTITIVWTPTFSSSAVASGNFYLFKTGAIVFDLYWDATAGRFKFSDNGPNITQSAVTTFTANTPVVIHITWGQGGGVRIYINGTQSGSTGGYNAYTGGGTLWLGSDATPANHCMGVFSAFTIYKQFMTSTQVSADDANMLTLVNDLERVDWIMWRQTLSGTNTVYTCIDTGKQNYAIIGGVPGTVEAITRMTLQSSGTFAFTGFGGLFMSRLKVPLDYQLSRLNDFYGELSGTADATSSGGAYQTISSLGTTPTICTMSILMKTVLIDL